MHLTMLLPLGIAIGDRVRMVKANAKAPKLSSVAEAIAASEWLRVFGIDNSGALYVEQWIRPLVNQTFFMVNCKNKTWEELSNSVETWLVAVPALDNET